MLISELRVVENGGYRLQWYFPVEDEWGSYLGEGDFWRGDADGLTEEAQEVKAASDAANPMAVSCCWHIGFAFEDARAANRARTAANAAMRAFHKDTSRYPEWAKVALVAGWKAPKGWEP